MDESTSLEKFPDGRPSDEAEVDQLQDGELESRKAHKKQQKKRHRHLKCDTNNSACRRCRENGEECVRAKSKIKFRTGSSAKYDANFAVDQPWLASAGSKAPLEYIDETAELVAYYNGGGDRDQDSESPAPGLGEEDILVPPQGEPEQSFPAKPPPLLSNVNGTALSYPANEIWSSPLSPVRSRDIGTVSHHSNAGDWDWAKLSVITPISQLSIPVPPSPSPFLRGLLKTPSEPECHSDETALQVVLLRFFIGELARWFDLCDPEKHFELIVPQRARSCPPLMNAILTASAYHLTRLKKYRNPAGIVFYDGRMLPGLTEDTALQYQNECLRDLMTLSVDPDQARNENLLAAATILRFYEEVDAIKGDNELFLKAANIFLDAQEPTVPVVPHSLPVVNHSGVDYRELGLPISSPVAYHGLGAAQTPSENSHQSTGTQRVRMSDGLRQAAYWVAVRQEVYSAFKKQRGFKMSLSRCEPFRSFAPAEDAVWADRLIIFCADVIDFCYGDTDPRTARDRWLELKQYLSVWGDVLPASFEPLYFREPDAERGQVFPEICYLADCHAAGIQHVELARILLAVYDPTRPKLGPGHVASMKALTNELKTIVLRLCGTAVSNRMAPPILDYAFLAISMCGEHFEERYEQEALIGVINELEREHGRPTAETSELLKSAWGWT